MIWLAPMMGYTHGWFRAMIQALHPDVHVMTEMLTLKTLHYRVDHPALWVHPLESYPALQIATGSVEDVAMLQDVLMRLPMQHINLNAGCPSPHVGQARMGAMMRHDAELTRNVLSELKKTGKTISLKTRLGVDDNTDAMWEEWLEDVLHSGVDTIFLHARIALLNGLNPAQNRSIPPLRYDRAEEIFSQYPQIQWVVNGGINTIAEIDAWRAKSFCSGVMLGRVAYQNPLIFLRIAQQEGIASQQRFKLWLDSVEDGVLCSRKIVCLLALTKGFKNAKRLRQSIVEHKGKKWSTMPLYEAFIEYYNLPVATIL